MAGGLARAALERRAAIGFVACTVGVAVFALTPAAGSVVAADPHAGARVAVDTAAGGRVKVHRVVYRAHNGARRPAWVVLPAWYRPGRNPRIPLVISPHGRGISGRANARLFGRLPAAGGFAVVSPDGQGRRLGRFSWGYAGQIADLARMPRIVRRALPWVRLDTRRVYAFGGSMGGLETLLLVARYPSLLAGAAAFDSTVDLTLQYRRIGKMRCSARCTRAWGMPVGRGIQRLMREEIGGTPSDFPLAYARRSPLWHARAIARSCVPLQLWWSRSDRIIRGQNSGQSGKLFSRVGALNADAPITGYVGYWTHSAEMRASSVLPVALADFGVLDAEVTSPLPLRILLSPTVGDLCRPGRSGGGLEP